MTSPQPPLHTSSLGLLMSGPDSLRRGFLRRGVTTLFSCSSRGHSCTSLSERARVGMDVSSEIGVPSEECQMFPGAQACPSAFHLNDPAYGYACGLMNSSLVVHLLMCVPSLEAVQPRTHELRSWGLGSNLAVTSVMYDSFHKARLLLMLSWACLNRKGIPFI